MSDILAFAKTNWRNTDRTFGIPHSDRQFPTCLIGKPAGEIDRDGKSRRARPAELRRV
jgi:hypothetical protein